jgi:hypothetical protein
MSWTDYEQKDARLRAAGWTVEYPDELTRVVTPPEGHSTPPDVPYIPGHFGTVACKRADWAPEGMTVWVPVLDPAELLMAVGYLGWRGDGA